MPSGLCRRTRRGIRERGCRDIAGMEGGQLRLLLGERQRRLFPYAGIPVRNHVRQSGTVSRLRGHRGLLAQHPVFRFIGQLFCPAEYRTGSTAPKLQSLRILDKVRKGRCIKEVA